MSYSAQFFAIKIKIILCIIQAYEVVGQENIVLDKRMCPHN